MTESDRYSRNTALVGARGQDLIFDECVLIAGLGGLGSHVGQQLAHLGVRRFALVDPDEITESSLNRVVGAVPSDAASATPKVVVARRTIQQIQPDAEITLVQSRLDDPRVVELLATCTSGFGCLENDAGRLSML